MAAVVLGGVTDLAWPAGWDGYLEGRGEIAIMRQPDERAAIAACAGCFGADGSGFLAQPFELPEPDAALFADERVERGTMDAVIEAFRQGPAAYGQDLYLEGRGWPFDASRIAVPVDVVHGERDTLVPLAHGRHTAELIPGSTFHLLPGHGHFTTLGELPVMAAARLRWE